MLTLEYWTGAHWSRIGRLTAGDKRRLTRDINGRAEVIYVGVRDEQTVIASATDEGWTPLLTLEDREEWETMLQWDRVAVLCRLRHHRDDRGSDSETTEQAA